MVKSHCVIFHRIEPPINAAEQGIKGKRSYITAYIVLVVNSLIRPKQWLSSLRPDFNFTASETSPARPMEMLAKGRQIK